MTRSGRPQPTVAREVERLHQAGLVNSELVSGRRVVWAATESAIFDDLRSMLIKTVGPKAVLEDRYRQITGVEQAFINGSWAAREQGDAGELPQDIDVLLIGSPVVAEVRSEADLATRTLGRDVNATVLTRSEWDAAQSGFVQHVKAGPLIELDVSQ